MRLITLVAAIAAMLIAFASPLAAASFAPYAPDGFKTAVDSGKSVVVHVHAQWCPTCRRQTPILDTLLVKPEFQEITAIRVDFDAETEFRRSFRVGYQSTIIVFKGGREVARSTGATDPEAIEQIVAKAL